MTAVTIVAGPAGAGKSTWVGQRAKWGDLTIDLDPIWRAVSGLSAYEKPAPLYPFALAARTALIDTLDELLDEYDSPRHAWFITGMPKADERADMAERLRAKVVVFEVSPVVCMQHIAGDPRRNAKPELWRPIVNRWWSEYQRRDGETIIRG